jgi:predicted nucleotidyltransferase
MGGSHVPEPFREGDFVESVEGYIFDVKGLIHPPDRVVAYVRYVPCELGERARNGSKYRKIYDLSDRYNFLRKTQPTYIVSDPVFGDEIIEVPRNKIVRHYEPKRMARRLLRKAVTPLEKKTAEMISRISEAASVSIESFGVSGSLLIGLPGPGSDMDIVVYGSASCNRVRYELKDLLSKDDDFKPYGEEKIRELYEQRQRETGISYEDYAKCERRKDFQGLFKGTDFFVRYVKEASETCEEYGSTRYSRLGYGRLEAVVTDDCEVIFTPCTYPLRNVELEGLNVQPPQEIVSFRGQFCEQARKEEHVIAQGKVELCKKLNESYTRLILGNTQRDFMIFH